MIQNNRVSKPASPAGRYLIYAIGEIILVVIGILIALQINNWNEQKKVDAFERESLLQIKENLIQDRKNLLDIKVRHQKAFEASERLVDDSLRLKNLDSVPIWLGQVVQFTRFQSLTNSYEALKSAGLQIVKNKELRRNLGVYYDDKVNNINKTLGDIEYTFNNQWLPLMETHATNFEFQKILEVGNVEYFFAETDAWRVLMLNRDNIRASVEILEQTIEAIDLTLSHMPKDLPKSE